MKRKRLLLVVLGVLGVIVAAAILFSGTLFSLVLGSQLSKAGEEKDLEIVFQDAGFTWGGSVDIEGLKVTDRKNSIDLAQVEKIQSEFSWGALFADPKKVDRVSIQNPIFTLYPGIATRFVSSDGSDTQTPNKPPTSVAEVNRKKGFGVQLAKGELNNGRLQYQGSAELEPVLLAQMDASVENVSDSSPFRFNLGAKASGESEGTIAIQGEIDPETFDGEVKLGIKDFSAPLGDGQLPTTNGNVSVKLENRMSHIQSTGLFTMPTAPPMIPKELSDGGGFEINWKVDSTVPQGDEKGPIQIAPSSLAIKGLKGGAQEIKGSGNYDPATAKGSFQVQADSLSAPLLNPFVMASNGMRIQSGVASLNFQVARNGEQSPFGVKGKMGLTNLSVQDLGPDKNKFDFKSIGVDLDAQYSPSADRLDLAGLSLSIDDIPLTISGTIDTLLDDKKTNLNLKVKGSNLDVGRLATLAAPSVLETGALSGRVGIDVSVKGNPSSSNFPSLEGSLALANVGVVPKENPTMKVRVDGNVQFDADTLQADDLDVRLAETPGKVSVRVDGYNADIKKVQAKILGVAIEPVVNLYKPEAAGLLTGNLDASIKGFFGQGEHPESLEITFLIKKGRLLTRHPVPATIVDLVGWDWLKGGYDLTDAKGKIVQTESGYKLDPIILMGAKGGLAITGTVGFDNRLAATARVNVAKAAVDEVPSLVRRALRAQKGSDFAFLDIPIGGTVNRPVPRIDFGTAVDTGINVLQEKLGDKYGDEIREKTGMDVDDVGGVLRGIFGGDKK
ncbi:MAG: DUF748 domain-containing protein [Candidatus Omnitrophica bacterium]|nr:DUF748 domain-containing protein [Candidatus Omnitrophota bacterium]